MCEILELVFIWFFKYLPQGGVSPRPYYFSFTHILHFLCLEQQGSIVLFSPVVGFDN